MWRIKAEPCSKNPLKRRPHSQAADAQRLLNRTLAPTAAAGGVFPSPSPALPQPEPSISCTSQDEITTWTDWVGTGTVFSPLFRTGIT